MALAVIQEQKVSADTLVDLHAQRTSSAEKAASSIEMQLKEAQATVVDLKSQLEQAKAGLKLAQETSIMNEQSISSTLSERGNELEKVVKDMEQQIEELSRRSADILLRYQQSNLVRSFRIVFFFCVLVTDNNRISYMQTDIEKNFVAYIMKQTRDIHEQDVVAKDNELRRASFF
jgi:hypothetical protein